MTAAASRGKDVVVETSSYFLHEQWEQELRRKTFSVGKHPREGQSDFPFSIEGLSCAVDVPEFQGDSLSVVESKCKAAALQLKR